MMPNFNSILKKSILILVLIVLAFFTKGQTIFADSTFIHGIWKETDSPFEIIGEAIIPAGDSLIIEPGVEVRFKTGTDVTHSGDNSVDVGYLTVKGKLIARGTALKPIKFTRKGNDGYWGCIAIVSPVNSVFEYCIIQYADKLDNYAGALSIYTPRTRLLNISVINNKYTGISTERVYNDPTTQGGSTPDIRNCIISGNQRDGLYLGYEYGAKDTIKLINNTISGNSSVGLATWGAKCLVVNCIFWNNYKSFDIVNDQLLLSYSLVQEENVAEFSGWSAVGEGMEYNVNPQLKQDYSLSFNSPCINAGKPDASGLGLPGNDVMGNNRMNLGRIDMGALESNSGEFICLTHPNGNEGFQVGNNINISWKSNAAGIKMEYTTDGGKSWKSIISVTPNTGTFKWQALSDESETYNIRISDTVNNAFSDTCDSRFTVFKSVIPGSIVFSGRFTGMNSPYLVNGEVMVPDGDSVVIDPGVVIRFKKDAGKLNIKGKLISAGTREQPVTFTRQGDNGYWNGIHLTNTKISSSLKYSKIEYAGTGIGTLNPQPVILNCMIVNNYSSGISGNASSPDIRNSVIAFNGEHGIYLYNEYYSKNVMLVNNTIAYNKQAGLYPYIARCQVENCLFWGNGKSVESGLMMDPTTISYCLVSENALKYNVNQKIGKGMIYNLNPQFADKNALDFHLTSTSPGIDQGNPDSGYENEPEDNGNRINLGSYGNTSEATKTEGLPRITYLSAFEGRIFGNDTITIKGTNFLPAKLNANIQFDKVEASGYLFWSNDSLVCITPPHLPDTVSINIHNNNGKQGTGLDCFTFKAPAVKSVTPFYLSCTGNENIQISGKYFGLKRNEVRLLFNQVQASSYLSWNDSVIVLKSPPHPEGFADLIFKLNENISFPVKGWLYFSEKTLQPLCGNIPGIMKKGNYLLSCSDTIPAGSSLKIEPGVLIFIKNDRVHPVSISVNGTLTAEGTGNDSIRILSVPSEKGLWDGITLNNNGTIRYCSISNARNGIYQISGNSTIENSRIEQNETGIYFYGDNKAIKSQVLNCLISGNNTGIIAEASGNKSHGGSDIEVISSSITGNHGDGLKISGHGYTTSGLIPVSQSSTAYLTLKNSVISGNKGHAVSLSALGFSFSAIPSTGYRYGYARIKSYNTLFYQNSKGLIAERVNKNPETNIYAYFYNSDFWKNNTVFELDATKAFFYNSILWDNQLSGIPYGICDSLVFESCDLNDLNVVKIGKNNISADPGYKSPDMGDFSLSEGSPCIDAGTNTPVDYDTDHTGKIRIRDGNNDNISTVDIGAFEYISPVSSEIADENLHFNVYPNPAGNEFFIRTGSSPVKKMTIYLIGNLGQTVKSTSLSSPAINHIEKVSSSELTKGVYIIRIITENWQKTEKIIIQ